MDLPPWPSGPSPPRPRQSKLLESYRVLKQQQEAASSALATARQALPTRVCSKLGCRTPVASTGPKTCEKCRTEAREHQRDKKRKREPLTSVPTPPDDTLSSSTPRSAHPSNSPPAANASTGPEKENVDPNGPCRAGGDRPPEKKPRVRTLSLSASCETAS
jgi:hypothetical protein